jgi:hypothetical protein
MTRSDVYRGRRGVGHGFTRGPGLTGSLVRRPAGATQRSPRDVSIPERRSGDHSLLGRQPCCRCPARDPRSPSNDAHCPVAAHRRERRADKPRVGRDRLSGRSAIASRRGRSGGSGAVRAVRVAPGLRVDEQHAEDVCCHQREHEHGDHVHEHVLVIPSSRLSDASRSGGIGGTISNRVDRSYTSEVSLLTGRSIISG